jgi:hypothetical protein
VRLGRQHWLFLAIVVAQAGWLGALLLRGWYSGPDLGNVAAATGRPLNVAYLTESLGGHLGVPERALYWVLERVAPLNWTFTVAIRLVVQALITVVLWRVLRSLVGPRPWLLGVVAVYAFSPLLVPGTAVLSSAVDLPVGQLLLLLLIGSHLRWTRRRQLRYAVLSGVLALVMLLVSDQAAAGVLLLPLLTLGFLSGGQGRNRVRALLRAWPEWVALAVAGLAFLGLYVTGDYRAGSTGLGFDDTWQVVRRGWWQILGPGLFGGPWEFAPLPNEWSAVAATHTVVAVLCQLGLLAAVVGSIRRTGARALLAWAMPVVVTLVTLVLVAVGRSALMGSDVTLVLRYSYFTAAALALGGTLAFARSVDEQPYLPTTTSARWRWPGVGLVGVVVLGSCLASLAWDSTFARNPSRHYVETLASSARATAPDGQVFDVPVPVQVIPFLEPYRHVSDVLGLTRVHRSYLGTGDRGWVPDDVGHLRPAAFVPVADQEAPTHGRCGTVVRAPGPTTVRLTHVGYANEWFLQLQLYQARSSEVRISVLGSSGEDLTPRDPLLELEGTLLTVNRRLRLGTPVTLTLSGGAPGSVLCLVHAYVGSPLPSRSG